MLSRRKIICRSISKCPFLENRMSIGANFLLASSYTGQTTETLALATDPFPFERVVGVPLKSYVSLTWTYYFKK
jgi:hypothetical protein